MEDGQDSDGVVSVTDSEDEEQKAKETFRAFVKQKGVLTLSFHTQSVVYYSSRSPGRWDTILGKYRHEKRAELVSAV